MSINELERSARPLTQNIEIACESVAESRGTLIRDSDLEFDICKNSYERFACSCLRSSTEAYLPSAQGLEFVEWITVQHMNAEFSCK